MRHLELGSLWATHLGVKGTGSPRIRISVSTGTWKVETLRDVRFSKEERYFPQEEVTQVFIDEGMAQIELEPIIESQVSERPRESVGSGGVPD